MLIKKRRGLFYLIITVVIIAAMVMACKNKPTGANDFTGFDDSVKVSSTNFTSEDFKTFIDRTIRSRKAITEDGVVGYFWADFTSDGMKYGQGTENEKGTLPYKASLATDAFTNNRAHFTDNNGSIEFQLDAGNTITNIKVTLSNSQFKHDAFDCQFVTK